MSQKARKEYLRAIRLRYHRSGKELKNKILNEFCEVCGYHRKHAIRLLNQSYKKQRKKPGPKKTYDSDVETVLKAIWLIAEQSCSKILKQVLPLWLPHYEQYYDPLPIDIRTKLLSISPATIDRILKPVRAKKPHGLCGTRPGSILRQKIPIRDYHWKPTGPGFLEADTVAHCGGSLEGDFVWSITFTDIATQWTENRAIWNKGGQGVLEQIKDVRKNLPFPLKGFHVDNGSEFLNNHLLRYFSSTKPKISFTRCRPNRSNDNAHVEQKNWTHVRQLLGYQRIDDPELVPAINDLYWLWGQYQNFFQPKQKLISKTRIGSKIIKKYDLPKTPYQRLLESPIAKELDLNHLAAHYKSLNPFALKQLIDKKLRTIFNALR